MATVAEALAQALQLHRAGDLQRAEQIYRQVVQVNPTHAAALHLLGVLAHQAGRDEEAVAYMQRALQADPLAPAFHCNLGLAYRALGRRDEAAASFQQALRLKPDYALAHNNLGLVLVDQGRLQEAESSHRRAVRLNPGSAELHFNLGTVLQDQGKLDEAVASYDRTLNLQPDHQEAIYNRAVTLLLAGDFERGWPAFNSQRRPPRQFEKPQWDGSSLAGRTILLHLGWGFGDMLQFVRYIPWVKKQGATVILACDGGLLPLLKGCPGVDQLMALGSPVPPHDVQLLLNFLPPILSSSGFVVPADIPYVFSDPARTREWRRQLRDDRTFKIGIRWQGNAVFGRDHLRSVRLAEFAPLARLEGVQLFSLQHGLGREQLAAVDFPVTDLGVRFETFADTAAAMVNLDLVVSIDSSVAHCAGSLGIPVWIALPYSPDWRWLLDREDSPWYPSMRLFRQSERGNWAEVFERIARSIHRLRRLHR